jgi:hypothetical protein
MNEYQDLTGWVFEHEGKYWKITGAAYPAFGFYSYPVISCSKTGKEYKSRNGFSARFVMNYHRAGFTRKAESTEKANITEGNRTGAQKRRIAFLTDRIARDTAELAQLMEGK